MSKPEEQQPSISIGLPNLCDPHTSIKENINIFTSQRKTYLVPQILQYEAMKKIEKRKNIREKDKDYKSVVNRVCSNKKDYYYTQQEFDKIILDFRNLYQSIEEKKKALKKEMRLFRKGVLEIKRDEENNPKKRRRLSIIPEEDPAHNNNILLNSIEKKAKKIRQHKEENLVLCGFEGCEIKGICPFHYEDKKYLEYEQLNIITKEFYKEKEISFKKKDEKEDERNERLERQKKGLRLLLKAANLVDDCMKDEKPSELKSIFEIDSKIKISPEITEIECKSIN